MNRFRNRLGLAQVYLFLTGVGAANEDRSWFIKVFYFNLATVVCQIEPTGYYFRAFSF
jgi:hypothetical protein